MIYNIILLFFLLFYSAAYAESEKLGISYEEKANPPYYLGEGIVMDREKPGIIPEILTSLEKKLDIRIGFIRCNWTRSLKLLEKNEIDAAFEASFKPDRMSIAVYPMKDSSPDPDKRLMRNTYVLYKLKNSPVGWDGKMFENLTKPIGATMSYSIVGDLKAMGVKVEEVYGPSDNLRMLAGGRLDGCAEQEGKADILLKNNAEKFKDIIKVSPPISTKDYYLVFSHKFASEHPGLMNAIWNELRRIRESGEYDRIAEKYAQLPN